MARTARISSRLGSIIAPLALAALLAAALPAGAQQTDFLFSTYLGGNSYDDGVDIAVDSSGYAWVTGTTYGDGFPGAGEPPVPEEGYEYTSTNGFAAAFDRSGSPFTMYVGGSFNEWINAVAAGVSGPWLAGTVDDPASYGALLVQPGGSPVPLPAELAGIHDVAVDAAGDVYITGSTWSSGFYVMKLTPSGDQIYLTSVSATPKAIAVDPAGSVYLLDTGDGFTKLSPAGDPVPYSPALAGNVTDIADIAVDPSGNLHLTGTAGGLYYASFSPTGAALASRVIPGAVGIKIALGPLGTVGLLGQGGGPAFPLVRPLPVSCEHNGCPNVIVTMVGTTIVTSSVFPYRNTPASLAFGRGGELYVVGLASDFSLPLVNAFQPEQNAETDAFVFAFAPPGLPPTCGAATAQPAKLWPDNHILRTIAIQGVTDPEGGAVVLRVTSIFQDEPTVKPYRPDGAGIGTASPRVRAARDGKRNGRVYTISFQARDAVGGACSGTVKVCVPLVEGGSCIDNGPTFDSTADSTPLTFE
jgi:Beta-propeller repeat